MQRKALTILVVVILHFTARASEPEYKLQPLKYNNPNLVVDLGVGLWAYPMPIDYDNDGDMDLLVACPDKPTQGTYFFENPSQDAKNRQPVFKPAVRVSDGFHYMMLSEKAGKPVILRPGIEYQRDPQTGQFAFDAPKQIKAKSPHPASQGRIRANMWRYVDFDGDGDQDMAVGIGNWSDLGWDHAYDSQGRWRNGPLHGYVYVINNDGSDEEPKFSDAPQRLQAGEGEVDVYGWPSPNFADFDDDGDLDLLCGEFLDGFTYFENTGSREQPAYAAGKKLQDSSGKPLKMHLQMITPTSVDWDADGDIDLVVGDEDGRVALVENTGRLHENRPVFLAPQYFKQRADELKFGALATPFAYDWDDDGDQDILCGNTAGSLGWFENLGPSEGDNLRWAAPELLRVKKTDGSSEPFRVMAGPNGSIQGPCEAKWGYTTFSVNDWDSDGDGDIIYNSILGEIGLLINSGGNLEERRLNQRRELPPKWNWRQTPASSTITQWRTTPLCLDFDRDGSLDLIMLDQEGYLAFRSSCGEADRIFVDENDRPIRLNSGTCGRSGRVKLAMVDWDGDSRLDLLVNSENATWYRNCETRNGKVVLKRIGNLARRNVAGHTSSPAHCDLDLDGKPDLLVGSENGRIYFISHDDCVTFTQAETTSKPMKRSEPPRITGLLQEEFLFAKAPFKECHASTVCETSRGLVAAWFGGTQEGSDDVGIWTSYHDGLKWSGPTQVADGIQHQQLRYPCWNPVLFQPPGDAPTLLFFKVGPNPREWWGEMMVSYDRGRTFRQRNRLPEGIDGPVRCKPVLLSPNRLLCGSSTEYDGWRVHFESVNLVDGLPSGIWQRVGPINDASQFNAIQPTLLQKVDHNNLAKLQILCRTKEGVIATSSSSDQGKTWSKLKATNLPNPNSGIDAVTLTDGRHLLVYNHLSSGESGWGRRGLLNLAISVDGENWERIGELENEQGAEFSYPAIIQSADGLVHITYTHKRKRVKHVVIDPSKID